MTTRDRTVLMVIAALALVAAGWFLLLAPVRGDAKALDGQLAAAQARLQTADTAVAAARRAEAGYRDDYATVARLGKAVPVDDDVPSLVVQLQSAARQARVDFRSIELSAGAAAPTTPAPVAPTSPETGTTGTTGATGAAGAAGAVPVTPAVATQPPGVAVDASGVPSLPLDLEFSGGYFRLADFVDRLTRFVKIDGQRLDVSGRLLTIDGIALKAGAGGYRKMQASVRANAYLLPEQDPVAAGADPAAVPGSPPAAPAQAAAR